MTHVPYNELEIHSEQKLSRSRRQLKVEKYVGSASRSGKRDYSSSRKLAEYQKPLLAMLLAELISGWAALYYSMGLQVRNHSITMKRMLIGWRMLEGDVPRDWLLVLGSAVLLSSNRLLVLWFSLRGQSVSLALTFWQVMCDCFWRSHTPKWISASTGSTDIV